MILQGKNKLYCACLRSVIILYTLIDLLTLPFLFHNYGKISSIRLKNISQIRNQRTEKMIISECVRQEFIAMRQKGEKELYNSPYFFKFAFFSHLKYFDILHEIIM